MIDPWGEERKDMRAGIVASATLAPHLKPGRKPPSPSEFVLYRLDADEHPAESTQSLAEMKAIFSQAKQSFESRKS